MFMEIIIAHFYFNKYTGIYNMKYYKDIKKEHSIIKIKKKEKKKTKTNKRHPNENLTIYDARIN